MQIICISRGSYGYGKELAEKLAQKLGYACLGREELVDRAVAAGIPVGKIEMAIVKRMPLTEALEIEINRFKALVTATLCEYAQKGSFVYHGRAGQMVLSTIPRVLRIRAIADYEERISMAMRRLKLNREKAKAYNDQVDEDIHRWVRYLYNVSWEDPSNYDITVNANQLSTDNAVSFLESMAKLPEFQIMDSVQSVISDLYLGARCQLELGKNEQTADMKVSISTEGGHVVVTYSPWMAEKAKAIPKVLEKVEGIASLVTSVATTNIAYIQERFNPEDENFKDLIEVAEKWNAAVQVIRYAATDGGESFGEENAAAASHSEATIDMDGGTSGSILIADEEDCEPVGCGVPEIMDGLIKAGRAGGYHQVCGPPNSLVKELASEKHYSLIVVGNAYLDKSDSVQKRLRRDLISYLADKFKIPVIETEGLKAEYLFGVKQWAELGGYGAIVALLYFLLFHFQTSILGFLSEPGTAHRVFATAIVVVVVPLAAYTIGNFAHSLLKLVKLE